jgi:hypothetical protein
MILYIIDEQLISFLDEKLQHLIKKDFSHNNCIFVTEKKDNYFYFKNVNTIPKLIEDKIKQHDISEIRFVTDKMIVVKSLPVLSKHQVKIFLLDLLFQHTLQYPQDKIQNSISVLYEIHCRDYLKKIKHVQLKYWTQFVIESQEFSIGNFDDLSIASNYVFIYQGQEIKLPKKINLFSSPDVVVFRQVNQNEKCYSPVSISKDQDFTLLMYLPPIISPCVFLIRRELLQELKLKNDLPKLLKDPNWILYKYNCSIEVVDEVVQTTGEVPLIESFESTEHQYFHFSSKLYNHFQESINGNFYDS